MYQYREIGFTKIEKCFTEKREHYRGPEIGNDIVNLRVQCNSKKLKRQQVEISKNKRKKMRKVKEEKIKKIQRRVIEIAFN